LAATGDEDSCPKEDERITNSTDQDCSTSKLSYSVQSLPILLETKDIP